MICNLYCTEVQFDRILCGDGPYDNSKNSLFARGHGTDAVLVLQKAKIFIHFTGFSMFGIWFWTVENLGSSHHASVVRDSVDRSKAKLF